MVNREPLFSERQVDELVKAKVALYEAQERLNDQAPNTVEVNVATLLTKLKEMEADVIKKHQQAVKAWRKAFSIYTDFLKKNPGSRVMNPPGDAPKLGSKVETIRGYIRGYEAITSKKVRMSLSEWTKLFQDASLAVAEMRAIRDNYVVAVSGLTLSALTTGSNTLTIR